MLPQRPNKPPDLSNAGLPKLVLQPYRAEWASCARPDSPESPVMMRRILVTVSTDGILSSIPVECCVFLKLFLS